MLPNVNQRTLIDNLNQYLAWHNLPVRVNKSGICNGLSSLYAKYVLEKREKEFFNLLTKISIIPKVSNPKMDDEINHFVVEVVLSFLPQLFNKDQNQMKAIENLQVNYNNLKSSFSFGLITTTEKWCSIFKAINLNESEVMLLATPTHVMSIRKEGGNYKLYDPNYPEGFKIFANERELLEELHLIAHTDLLIGLNMQVIRHPEAKTRDFPSTSELYRKYLSVEFRVRSTLGEIVNNLYYGIVNDNEGVIDQFFIKGGDTTDLLGPICQAITFNAPKSLKKILERLPENTKKLDEVFKTTLGSGYQSVFKELLNNKQCKEYFTGHVMHEENATKFIAAAVEGNNVKLLEQLIDCYKKEGHPKLSDKQVAEKIIKISPEGCNVVQKALRKRDTTTVIFLLEQLNKAGMPSSAKQLLIYLADAIKSNQPHMVDLMIDMVRKNLTEDSQKQVFAAIKMNTTMIDKADLSILRKLQSCGVPFTDASKGIINQKANRPVGTLLSIGITLARFTDYLKEQWYGPQKDEFMENIQQFKEWKKEVKVGKSEENVIPVLQEATTPLLGLGQK